MLIEYYRNRRIPVRIINGDFRACTVSERVTAGSVGMYAYTGGSNDTYVVNSDTLLYHQPSLYGNGIAKVDGVTTPNRKKIVLLSVHYSPLSLPTLGVAPGSVLAETDCRYVNGCLDLQRVNAENAIHNVVLVGPGAELQTNWGFDTYLGNSAYHSNKVVRITASAWFFLRASATDDMVANFGKVIYKVNAYLSGARPDSDETCEQTPSVTTEINNGWVYYMIKTQAGNLIQSDPYNQSSGWENEIYNPNMIYQPTVELNFTGTAGTCTVQALSWGYDCWAYDWINW